MVLGIDFHQTITSYPTELRHLARAVIADGGEVHVISAVKYWNVKKTKQQIIAAGIPHTGVHVLNFSDYNEVPSKKLDLARKLGIELFFDDNPATIYMFASNGLLACKVEGISKRGEL